MDLVEAIRRRRSANRLTDPAPSDDEMLRFVADAATAPDHGLLRPWRLVLLRGKARELLGSALADELPGTDPAARARAAEKPLRAPLLVSIVLIPQDNPKVPRWEQLAAVTAMVQNLGLLLHGCGFGAKWRTGPASRSPKVRELLGLAPNEQLLGWLYVGTPENTNPPPPRPPLAVKERVLVLTASGDLVPARP